MLVLKGNVFYFRCCILDTNKLGNMTNGLVNHAKALIILCISVALLNNTARAQIHEPDGLRIPGAWNSWTNTHNMGGDFDLTKTTDGLDRWTTTFEYTGSTGSVGFKFASGGSANPWNNQWACHGFTLDAVNSVGICNSSDNTASLTQNNHYTIVFKDNGYATTSVCLMETSASPVAISGQTRTTAPGVNPAPTQDVTIEATLSGTKSAEERVFLVYTADGWTTRAAIELENISGTSGSATIPGQTGGTTVNYYFASSTIDLEAVTANEENFDIRSIATGGASSYAVASTYESAASPTTWNSASSWAAGLIPSSAADVTLNGNLSLDGDITLASLTLESGTFTAGDGTPRTITITGGGAISNTGGTYTSSGEKIIFSGSGTTTGTLSFNNVELNGGVNFGAGCSIQGALEIRSGGYVNTNAPTFGTGSTLKYNNGGTYGVGTEWNSPHHVSIASGSELDFNTSGAESCDGNITIDAGGNLNMDAMTGALTAAGNVTINGTLSMSTVVGGDLEVGGDFELASGGTFNENDRALTFNGTGAQSVNGNTNLVLKYAIVNKASGTLTLNTPLEIEAGGILWPTSGTLDLNSEGLTMHSDATGTAAIGAVGTGGITGNVTFERYIPDNTNDAASFVNLSSYVSGINATNWTGAGAAWIFEYDEANTGGLNDGWGEVSGTLSHSGKGYMAEFPGNTSVTLSYTGALTSGNQGVAVTNTSSGTADNDGWNLVGNPYPASVTYANLSWTASEGVTKPSGFFIYDGDNGDYTTLTASDVIGVGQSFWVQAASGNGTLTFEESDKTTDSSPFIRSLSDPEYFALRVEEASGKWSRGIVGLLDGTTTDFEVEYDLRTFGNPIEEEHLKLWFQTDAGEDLAIQAVSRTATDMVPIRVMAWNSGVHTFTMDEQYGVPESLCLVLHDAWTGESHMMTEDTALELDLDGGVVYEGRFAIGWNVQPTLSTATTWCTGGAVDLGWTPVEAEGWQITWAGPQSGNAENEALINGLAAGFYEIFWVQENGLCLGSLTVEIGEACVGDYNQNDNRGVEDLLALLAHFAPDLEGSEITTFDCDCDGQMTIGDLLIFLTVFGTSCN